LGFVHRDLKPDNIVVNTERPLQVALIDFDRALPRSNTCHTGTRGTPGYQPNQNKWFDGDVMWDYYALVCTVLECDMPVGKWAKINDEIDIKKAAKAHID
jgi:serine/threonine protein kinase